MARPKKNREASIIHFSFFDLLFGAFGAFVFLMIMQVLTTLNLVDVDIQKLVDETVKEKNVMKSELERFKGIDVELASLKKQYDQAAEERKQLVQEKEQLSQEKNDLNGKVKSLDSELASLKKYEKESTKKEDIISSLQNEKRRMERELDAARRKLSDNKTVPLKIRTKAFPTTITEEKVDLALSAVGGAPPYSWEMKGSLPGGLTFNKITGSIGGIVKSSGQYNFGVKVTDSKGLNVSREDIPFKVIKKYKEQEEKVSKWFLIMLGISSLLLLYIFWGKYKNHKAYKKMIAGGYKPVWVKE